MNASHSQRDTEAAIIENVLVPGGKWPVGELTHVLTRISSLVSSCCFAKTIDHLLRSRSRVDAVGVVAVVVLHYPRVHECSEVDPSDVCDHCAGKCSRSPSRQRADCLGNWDCRKPGG